MKSWSVLFCALVCAPAIAAQTIDPREYVDWNSYPYNQIVAFEHVLSTDYAQNCTAQYVAKDIILTARHCITQTNEHDNWAEKGKSEYTIYLPNKTFTKDLVLKEYGYDTHNNDWALLQITDPQFYSETPLSIDNTTHIGNVTSVGFGYMRILNDQEIHAIRDHLIHKCTNINNEYCTSGCTANCINSLISLDDTNTDYTISYHKDNATYKISNIINHLKAHRNCQIINTAQGVTVHLSDEKTSRPPKYDSTCRIVNNDSGGLYVNQNNKIQAIISSSVGDILTSDNAYHSFPQPIESDLSHAYTAMLNSGTSASPTQSTPVVTRPENTNNTPASIVIQPITKPDNLTINTPNLTTPSATAQNQPTPVVDTPSQPDNNPTNIIAQTITKPDTQTTNNTNITATEIQQQISEVDKKINDAVTQDNLTDEKTFDILVDVATYQELQKKYEAARAREQSVPNKLLGGLTMAATGIGGMQLASGMAEQAADEAAERDMQAYLATFRCDYGAGRNITGGEVGIELPGANDLTAMVTEYRALAADIAQRKDALGMSPGIEAEVVFDKSETGLYDNIGTGAQPGAFTSLSRALLDENGDDAKAWAAQKQSAHDKKNTGLTIGATGAAAGLAGNIVINDVLNKDKTQDTDTNNETNKK